MGIIGSIVARYTYSRKQTNMFKAA